MFEPFLWPLAGGIMIGLAAGGLYLMAGEIAGISGIVRSAAKGPGRSWQLSFILGLLIAGLVAYSVAGTGVATGLAETPLVLLAIAGGIVGIGTGIGNGCTSGHGVCGLSRLSPRSLVAVPVFMATAAITVFIMRHGGLL